MFVCFLFGLLVIIVLVTSACVVQRFVSSRYRAIYKCVLGGLYMGAVCWLTLFSRFGRNSVSVRMEPFYVLRQMLKCWGGGNISASKCRAVFKNSKNLLDGSHATPVEDLLLNIILFIPMGFLLPYIWPKLNFYKTILVSLCFSVTIEALQYVGHWGCCDIDDIINDTLGTCVGYMCWRVWKRLTNCAD